MNDLLDYLQRAFARDLAGFEREIELFPSDEAVWSTVPGIANSAGTLALHVCGNLRHYIGATLGSSGYVRDRNAEFCLRNVPRSELVSNLHGTRDVVLSTLAETSPDSLAAVYPETLAGASIPTRRSKTGPITTSSRSLWCRPARSARSPPPSWQSSVYLFTSLLRGFCALLPSPAGFCGVGTCLLSEDVVYSL